MFKLLEKMFKMLINFEILFEITQSVVKIGINIEKILHITSFSDNFYEISIIFPYF